MGAFRQSRTLYAMLACVLGMTIAGISYTSSASTPAVKNTASMPAPVCEIRQRAWCIIQANSVITDIPAWEPADPDHTWMIHHRKQPDSNLVIFEPRGCRKAPADTVEAIRFLHGVMWEGRSWDEMKVRLRRDGTCDLTLRVPTWSGDPLEWPFAEGRVNLVACKDEACNLNQPTIADVTEKYRSTREGK